MTVFYSTELANFTALPVVKVASAAYGARMVRFRASITLASQATTDTIVVAVVPAGFTFAYGILNTDTSLSTSTISIGTAATPAKYRAAAVFTATDTPTLFGKASAEGAAAQLAADETVIITIATAALPASGNLVVDMFYSRQ